MGREGERQEEEEEGQWLGEMGKREGSTEGRGGKSKW